MSHAGSTTYFPVRVVRQLGGLQTVPEDTARTRFEHTWREDQTPADRQSNVEQILDAWRTVITELPYFLEHPTLDERDFQATEEYIIRFYRWGPAAHEDLVNSPRVEDGGSPGATPTPNMAIQAELTHLRAERDHLRREVFYRWGPAAHEDLVNSPRVEDGGSPGATPTPNMAIQAELTHLRAERDHLRREVAEKNEQLGDQHQLQKKLAQARAQLQRRDQELAQVNTALERSRKRTCGGPRTP
ncbi:hypothetical protein CDL15_Pgr019253 [Punica granatum]|uniref:Uncharacterized protein n=1 Tax=Punica granatum TaxID=22663 RepID=A0A218Y2A0_PUNGR|nr:hypothetical protein CDL15_Pgr019253 [Punica granatum]